MNQSINRNLIEDLKEGDEYAFRKIYEKYHRAVYGIAFKYLKNKSLAEDAVHDVFVKLWDHRKKIDVGQSLKGFLFTTTKNHVLNMIRDRKRDEEKNKQYSHLKPTTQNKTIAKLTLKNYKQVFEYFLEQLPEGKKEIFELKMQEGKTNKNIAQELDISINTVKSQYYQASKFIKKQLEEHTELSFE